MTTDEKNTKQLTPWEQWEQSQRKGTATGTFERIMLFLARGCVWVLGWMFLLLAFSFFLGRGFLDVNPF